MKYFLNQKLSNNIKIFSLVLFSIAIVILIYNLYLENKLNQNSTGSNIITENNYDDTSEFDSIDVKIINNEKIGIWDKEKKNKIKIDHELTIYDEDDPNKNFHRVIRVNSDNSGNIYVHELMSGEIRKYNKNGDYVTTIGNKGGGPGEFLSNVGWIIDEGGILHALDGGTQRLSHFENDGTFLDSYQISQGIRMSFRGFIRDTQGNYYVSFYDADLNKVIHKFNQTGKYINSFGDPVKFKGQMTVDDYMIRKNISSGRLCLVKDGIFYTQMNPYEIRKYSFSGKLMMKIYRKNSFMPQSKVKKVDGGVRLYVPVASTVIGYWNEKIINCVYVPYYIKSSFGTVIDIFSLEGNLLTSLYLKEIIKFKSVDKNGKLYGVLSEDGVPEKIVRYGTDIL